MTSTLGIPAFYYDSAVAMLIDVDIVTFAPKGLQLLVEDYREKYGLD